MSIWHSNWPWYVATFVMSERSDGNSTSYAISAYLIHASGAEEAFSKAQAVQATLGESFRDNNGTVVHHACLGLQDLDTLQEVEMKNGTHLLWMQCPSSQVPATKARSELSLFLPPVPRDAT
jgi:hypothetical protein